MKNELLHVNIADHDEEENGPKLDLGIEEYSQILSEFCAVKKDFIQSRS